MIVKPEDRPSREVLKKKIRKQSFGAIGREYGVTDRVVRKWAMNYGLPTKREEIDKMSAAEWREI